MKTWTLQTKLDSTGRLHLDVPIADGPQEVDVVLVVSPCHPQSRRANWDVVDARLGTLSASEDPAQWQRRIRSEWSS